MEPLSSRGVEAMNKEFLNPGTSGLVYVSGDEAIKQR
jgi:hypothetical protein